MAGGSIKNTIDGAFKNMASAVANKVCFKKILCINESPDVRWLSFKGHAVSELDS